jgi:hypothetical protein
MKTVFGAGPIKRIHVNQHVIRANKRDGAQDPPLSVKVGGRTLPAHDAAWLRYRANFPGGHVSTVGKAAFAASRRVSLATFYRRLKQAEDFVISCVGERLQADIRKRQGEDGLHS